MDHSNRPRDYLTVKDRVAEEVGIARAAYLDGTYSGHRHGYDTGYVDGFSEGLRSSIAYKQGARDGYMDGYQDGKADRRYIQQREAA